MKRREFLKLIGMVSLSTIIGEASLTETYGLEKKQSKSVDAIKGLWFNKDGSLFYSSASDTEIFKYSLSTPFDLSTRVYESVISGFEG